MKDFPVVFRTSQETHYVSMTTTNWLILLGVEITAVCCETHTEENAEFVKATGTHKLPFIIGSTALCWALAAFSVA
jgi:hypothetical protein